MNSEMLEKLIGIWGSLFSVVGPVSLVAWIGTLIKWFSDQKKWKLERQDLIGKQIAKLDDFNKSHEEADRNFGECSRRFRRALETKPTNREVIQESRDELCRALNDLISRSMAHFEFYCHVYQSDSDRLSSLCESTIRELRIWSQCQDNVNKPLVLSTIGRSPLKISKHSLMPIKHALSHLRLPVDAKNAIYMELNRMLEPCLQ